MQKIPHEILEKCYHYSALAYPEEACGFISGNAQEEASLIEVHPMSNTMDACHAQDSQKYPHNNRNAYLIDPLAQIQLEKALQKKQQRIRVIYHSHPDGGAYFSEKDQSDALWQGQPRMAGVCYLVCGIKQQQPAGAILARFNPKTQNFDTFVLDEPAALFRHAQHFPKS